MNTILTHVLSQFQWDSAVTSCEPYGCGHINKTYRVCVTSGSHYILQMIGPAFKDIRALQENITAVTEHLHSKSPERYSALTLIPTLDGGSYYTHTDGCSWRAYEFVEDGICLQTPECPEDFYQSAVAFGTFQQHLADFPADRLHETIPNFHNTPDRFRIFRQTIARDPHNRVCLVRDEIAFALAREEKAGTLIRMLEKGELPLRVTHNDTKLNNVMLRASDRTPLCIMDLDTTMPGLSAYDFGDAIRFGASTAAEDEKDLSKVTVDLEMYRLFVRGFLEACPNLTENERKVLPISALIMSLECGVRFLTDFIDGDHYFGIHYPEQNLDRARTQLKLVADMEQKMAQMEAITAAGGK